MTDSEKKILRKFFLGNGLETTDHVKAANDLLGRDHKKIIKILKRHGLGQQCRGLLGAYFVPPMFFGIPEVIRPEQYDEKVNTGKFLHNVSKKIYLFVTLKPQIHQFSNERI